MADCKAKYLTAVHQFIRLVSMDAKAYMTFIKQVKEISLQYQTDLRDANIAKVWASVQHLDGRYFDQELASSSTSHRKPHSLGMPRTGTRPLVQPQTMCGMPLPKLLAALRICTTKSRYYLVN